MLCSRLRVDSCDDRVDVEGPEPALVQQVGQNFGENLKKDQVQPA